MQDEKIIYNIFNDTIGKHLIELKIDNTNQKGILLGPEIEEFLNLVCDYLSLDLAKYSEDIRQFYLWYLLGRNFLFYNEYELKVSPDIFDDIIYYPNMMDCIITYLKKCKKLLYQIVRCTYKEIEDTSSSIIDFYFVLSNTESSIIKSDVLNIFIKSVLLETNPLDIDNLKIFYSSSLRHLFFSYLRSKTDGLLSTEIDSVNDWEEDKVAVTAISSRYTIYESGLRLSQLSELCRNSNTLKYISKNYDHIKGDIINNSLQQLYSLFIDKNPVTDKKLLILKTNAGSYNLSKIKQKMPLIYKLLRSVHVLTNSDYTALDLDKDLIRECIYNCIYLKFRDLLDTSYASALSKLIATNLTKSLTCGKFLDPYNLESVNICGHMFITQLEAFLSLILENIECNFNSRKKPKIPVSI